MDELQFQSGRSKLKREAKEKRWTESENSFFFFSLSSSDVVFFGLCCFLCSSCTFQGPTATIRPMNRQRKAGRLCWTPLLPHKTGDERRTKTPDVFVLLLSLAVVSLPQVVQKMRRTAGLCLPDLRPIAGFAWESVERGGADVKETWVPVFISGLRGQRMASAKAFPCCVSVWTWQK